MRTKTLLLTAALTAAGALTSMAQVYSVNVVGYVTQTIGAAPAAGLGAAAGGLKFYNGSNPLDNKAGNKLKDVIPLPADGSYSGLVFYNPAPGGGFATAFADGADWDNPDLVLAPGYGWVLE